MFGGHTSWCSGLTLALYSGITPDFMLRDKVLRGPYAVLGLKLGSAAFKARQALYTLQYLSCPSRISFFFKKVEK